MQTGQTQLVRPGSIRCETRVGGEKHALEQARVLCRPEVQARLRPCEPGRLYDVLSGAAAGPGPEMPRGG